MLHCKVDKDYHNNLMTFDYNCHTNVTSRNEKIFNKVENAGSEMMYRCINCRNCKDCKDHDSIEAISTREEVEQYIINQSVVVNIKERTSSAKLPLLHNPEIKLADNKDKALKVYNQQVRKLNKAPMDKQDVIKSEQKMQELGFVEYVKNLTKSQQLKLQQSKVQNFIPWRAVWNGNSISTPCRLVFDASQPTSSKNCLNDIVAKGQNNMNKLVEILIRWMTHKIGLHTDISKMYNSVKLHEEHWPLQRYIWESTLNDKHIPKKKSSKR